MHKNSLNDSQFVTQNVTQNQKEEINCTDKTVKYLKPKSKRMTYWFKGLNGFGIRVSPKGVKTWTYTYRFDGYLKKMTIGRYPRVPLTEALKLYSEAVEKKERGIDPALEKVEQNRFELKADTVSELLDRYVEYCKARGKKSWEREYKEILRYIIPAIGKMKVHHVKKKHLVPIFSYVIMERNAPQSARHLFAYTRRMFNIAIMWDFIETNPCTPIKLNISPNRRERHLSPKEVYRFWHGLNEVNSVPVIRLILKFMLCTACRGIEVREMRWDNLDKKDRIWTIPKTKNSRMHRVHLCQNAMKIIEEVKLYTGDCDYVFGASKSPLPPKKKSVNLQPYYRTSICKTIRKIRKDEFFIEPFIAHDLRRTATTLVTAMGCPRYWAKLLLNHTDHDITGIYDQYGYDWEKKKGLEILDYVIEHIITSQSIDQVPSLIELRENLSNQMPKNNFMRNDFYTVQDSLSIQSIPVAYTLSYDLATLKGIV